MARSISRRKFEGEWVRVNAPTRRVADEVLALLAVASRPGVLDYALPADLTGGGERSRSWTRLTDRARRAISHRSILGQGGAATVFLAHEYKHDRQVVLKVLRPDVARWIGADRFLAEIHILARLSHPHILALIDSGDADGLLYYVMPYVGGETLRERLCAARSRRTKRSDSARHGLCARPCARAALVHRDLKPDNILIVVRPRVPDGLRDREAGIGDRNTGDVPEGFAIGTPAYMAPEQAAGRTVDVRADLYSWGILAARDARWRRSDARRHCRRPCRAACGV